MITKTRLALIAPITLTVASILLAGCTMPAAERTVTAGGVVKETREVEMEATAEPREAAPPKEGSPKDPAPEPTATAGVKEPQRQHTLTAGMVDDNEKWDDYLLYRLQNADIANSGLVHDRDVSERYVVTIQDRQGYPMLGARVAFYVGQQEVFAGYTHATGRVLFFPKALGVSDDVSTVALRITYNDYTKEARLVRGETYNMVVSVDTGTPHDFAPPVDILFLLDATGSMQDEIDALKSNVHSIASEIASLSSVSDIRFGLTVYRDRGDVFVTRTYDFADVSEFAETLSSVEANGGGDYPESVNEGLHEAIHTPSWRDDAVRIVIWIGDAPPHMDYVQDYDYAAEMEQAARRGIKIFAIAASGLDYYGEYIWRQVAQFTEGKFIFLTYADAAGEREPGTETKFNVEEYSVENLDALVVRLVIEELAWQTEAREQ